MSKSLFFHLKTWVYFSTLQNPSANLENWWFPVTKISRWIPFLWPSSWSSRVALMGRSWIEAMLRRLGMTGDLKWTKIPNPWELWGYLKYFGTFRENKWLFVVQFCSLDSKYIRQVVLVASWILIFDPKSQVTDPSWFFSIVDNIFAVLYFLELTCLGEAVSWGIDHVTFTSWKPFSTHSTPWFHYESPLADVDIETMPASFSGSLEVSNRRREVQVLPDRSDTSRNTGGTELARNIQYRYSKNYRYINGTH